jgi:micrococcal nuclease
MRPSSSAALAVVVVIGAALAGCGAGETSRCELDVTERCGPPRAKVVRVVDGDTAEIASGVKVRYLLVDTPELSGNELFSQEARDYNRSVVEGRDVELEYDEACRDRYQRLLCYVCVGGVMVNEELLRRGLAKTLIIPPNRRYEAELKAIEAEAKAQRLGIWQ